VVTLTALHKGLEGNDINVAVNYGGSLAGETMPAGLTLTFEPMAGGAGTPDLNNAIANMGDDPFEYVAFPFTDSTSMLAIETEYGFGDSGRWGWMRELYGHVFSAKRGSYAELMVWGPNNNSGVISVMSMEATMPSPQGAVAAAYAAKAGHRAYQRSGAPAANLVAR
jgi:phage tail sheath gpL-like